MTVRIPLFFFVQKELGLNARYFISFCIVNHKIKSIIYRVMIVGMLEHGHSLAHHSEQTNRHIKKIQHDKNTTTIDSKKVCSKVFDYLNNLKMVEIFFMAQSGTANAHVFVAVD